MSASSEYLTKISVGALFIIEQLLRLSKKLKLIFSLVSKLQYIQ